MMLTIRDSVGGPRLMSIHHALALALPAAALVVLQESSTPFANGWLVVATALLQHLAATVVMLAVPLLQRWRPVLPLRIVFVILAAGGIARGLVGGGFAAAVTAADPQFALRILAWVLVSVVWVPILVYAEAQIRNHSVLLAAWYSSSAQLVVETVRASRSYAAQRESLVRAVRDTVMPVIREIQNSVGSITLNTKALESVSSRLESVQAEAVTIIESEPVAVEPRAISMLEPHAVAALGRYHRSRSIFVSFLTAVMLASVAVPTALLLGSPESGLRAALVVVLTCAVLALSLGAVSRWRLDSFRPVVIALVIAASAGAVAMLVLQPFAPSIELGIAIGFPPVVAIAAAALSTAIGVGIGNQRLADRVETVGAEAAELATRSAALEAQVRRQVGALLHGPVLGRLSACVMALNFHASGVSSADPRQTATVTAAVMAHLALAAEDLEKLSHSAS